MAKYKNLQTGEIVEVKNTVIRNGEPWFFNKTAKVGEKWLSKRPMFSGQSDEMTGTAPNLAIRMILADGWVIDTSKPERKPRAAKVRQPEPEQPQPEQPKETEVPEQPQPTQPEPVQPEQPQPQPQTQPVIEQPAPTFPAPTFNVAGLEGGLAQVFAPVFQQVASQIEANIREKVATEMADLKRVAEEKARCLKIELPDGTKTKVEGVTMDGFDDMVRDLSSGYAVYMYGPAGTGKSHTAKQLADALGLPYYELNQVEFAHEVAGYGDASGKYVGTPLYEAVTKGGLLFFDEFDRSAQSATTIVNTLLANRRFTFPVVGNVDAHPNFRVVAAGNTTMTGASNEYVAANVIDASSRDRFVFYKTYYDERIELPVMAGGDKELIDFMQDLRQSIEKSHIQLVASMRATKYLHAHDNNKRTALERGLFKGMDAEDIRVLYNNLSSKGLATSWSDAMNELC